MDASRVFSIANQAAVATTAALATTWTGLAIGNPVHSGKICKIIEFGFALSLAGSKAGAIGLMTGSSLVTAIAASLTPRPAIVNGSATSKMLATAGQTIATPVLEKVVGSYGTVATSSWGVVGTGVYRPPEGTLILTPGSFIATYNTLDTTAAFVFHFVWEEVPQ